MDSKAIIRQVAVLLLTVTALFGGVCQALHAQASAAKKPNIIVIMGDDIGWFNLGSYNQGIMLNATPNLDKFAKEGMRLTDYPMQAGGSFSIQDLKEKVEAAQKAASAGNQ
jgi:arylsulfatase